MLGNIGAGELIIIIAVLVAIFGKKKATEIARDVGEVRKEIEKLSQESQKAVEDLKKPISLSSPENSPTKKESQVGKSGGGDQPSA